MGKMPKKTTKPAVALGDVPNIKKLCSLLGFQSASTRETDKFLETAREFRRSFQLSHRVTIYDGMILKYNASCKMWRLHSYLILIMETGIGGTKGTGIRMACDFPMILTGKKNTVSLYPPACDAYETFGIC